MQFCWPANPAVKQHPEYPGAKTGDIVVATKLVNSLVDEAGIAAMRELIAAVSESGDPVLVSAHAYERQSVNAIPIALAKLLSERLGIPFETNIVQTNVVSHTGADGYGRLARQARFEGGVDKGREYVMVDDFVGQGRYVGEFAWLDPKTGRQGRRCRCADRQAVLR